jgi:hypothetical protein
LNSVADFASRLEGRINEASDRLGCGLGWRLFYSPLSVLEGASVAFIGLNPGGRFEPSDHPRLASDDGSAYVTEIWHGQAPGQDKLQLQVRALFDRLGVRPDQVLAGNLVPFRSPAWRDLPSPKDAEHFGEEIWREIFARAKPRLIICNSQLSFKTLLKVFDASAPQSAPAGWGNITVERAITENEHLVRFPHFSRFPIVNRPESQDAMRFALGDYLIQDSGGQAQIRTEDPSKPKRLDLTIQPNERATVLPGHQAPRDLTGSYRIEDYAHLKTKSESGDPRAHFYRAMLKAQTFEGYFEKAVPAVVDVPTYKTKPVTAGAEIRYALRSGWISKSEDL